MTGTFNNCLDEKEKYRVERDENNKLTFRFIDDVEVTENGSNKFNIKIKIDESVKNKKHYLDRLLNKKIERMKLSNVKIKKTSFEIRQSNIMISANVFVSSTDSFIAILKMAYEFAVSNISDYINDKEAKAISKTLETADLKKAMKYVNGSSSLLRNEDVVGLNKIFAMNNVHFFIVNNF